MATNWGGLRDLVVPGRTGFLADTYLSHLGPRVDWGSVLEPAARLLCDRTAWDEMANQSRDFAVSMLSRLANAARLQEALREACPVPPREGRHVTFTAAAQELIFRTISLNARHPEIRDAGDEFRLVMQVDGGVHFRFLAGPAASSPGHPACAHRIACTQWSAGSTAAAWSRSWIRPGRRGSKSICPS